MRRRSRIHAFAAESVAGRVGVRQASVGVSVPRFRTMPIARRRRYGISRDAFRSQRIATQSGRNG